MNAIDTEKWDLYDRLGEYWNPHAKRMGYNTISNLDEIHYQIEGYRSAPSFFSGVAEGEKSVAAHGDSGGPLLANGKIFGVASLAAADTKNRSKAMSWFMRLDRPDIALFLQITLDVFSK